MLTKLILPDFEPICSRIRIYSDSNAIIDGSFETELEVSIPGSLPPANASALPISTTGTDNITLEFKPAEVIKGGPYRNECVDIFRGTISSTTKDGNTDRPLGISDLKVVCKIAYKYEAIKSLKDEAHNYTSEHLQQFQGKSVPYFYGFFRNKPFKMACIILEDCGNPIDGFSLTYPPLEVKKHIMKAVAEIHCAGIRHTELLESHHILLSDSNEPFIVDWKNAQSDHQCPIDLGKGLEGFHIGDWEPKEVDCPGLYRFTQSLEAWIPDHVAFQDVQIPSLLFKKAQGLMNYIKQTYPGRLPEEESQAWALIEGAITSFHSDYGAFLYSLSEHWPTKRFISGKLKGDNNKATTDDSEIVDNNM